MNDEDTSLMNNEQLTYIFVFVILFKEVMLSMRKWFELFIIHLLILYPAVVLANITRIVIYHGFDMFLENLASLPYFLYFCFAVGGAAFFSYLIYRIIK